MMRLIDADALCDDVMERYCKDCEKRKGIKRGKWRVIYEIGEAPCRACDVDDLKMELDEAPTIDAEPIRHGHWIKKEPAYSDGSDIYRYECSECHYWDEHNVYREVPYCWVPIYLAFFLCLHLIIPSLFVSSLTILMNSNT